MTTLNQPQPKEILDMPPVLLEAIKKTATDAEQEKKLLDLWKVAQGERWLNDKKATELVKDAMDMAKSLAETDAAAGHYDKDLHEYDIRSELKTALEFAEDKKILDTEPEEEPIPPTERIPGMAAASDIRELTTQTLTSGPEVAEKSQRLDELMKGKSLAERAQIKEQAERNRITRWLKIALEKNDSFHAYVSMEEAIAHGIDLKEIIETTKTDLDAKKMERELREEMTSKKDDGTIVINDLSIAIGA